MTGLKVLCGSVLTQLMANDPGLVFASLEAARLHELPRLEDSCHKTIAQHLDEICDTEEFAQLVLDDAMAIKGRQQTDSIPLVDDIRHHITQLFAYVPAQENEDTEQSGFFAGMSDLEEKEREYDEYEDEDDEEFYLADSEAFRRHKVLDDVLQRLNLAGDAFRDRLMEM